MNEFPRDARLATSVADAAARGDDGPYARTSATPLPVPPGDLGWQDGARVDAFLAAMRGWGDPEADDVVRELREARVTADATRAYFSRLRGAAGMHSALRRGNAARVKGAEALASAAEPRARSGESLADAIADIDEPAPVAAFVRKALGVADHGAVVIPTWIDRTAVLDGQAAFDTRSLPSILVLLCKSLPEGYGAPAMARVLSLSGQLASEPYHRLMGTLELLVTVSTVKSFEGPDHAALVAAAEIRLMHAGVRSAVARVAPPSQPGDPYRDWPGYDAYVAGYGLPVNQADMLGTILGFSLLVVEGLEALGAPFRPDQAEDYYQMWRTFGQLMGIHPPGRPADSAYLPPTLADARACYAVYARQNYVTVPGPLSGARAEAERANRAGCILTDRHVWMLTTLVPGGSRYRNAGDEIPRTLGYRLLSMIPRFYVRYLIGDAAAARVGLDPAPAHGPLQALLVRAPAAWARLWRRTDAGVHEALTRWFLEKLIHDVYGEPVSYLVPLKPDDLVALVNRGARPGTRR